MKRFEGLKSMRWFPGLVEESMDQGNAGWLPGSIKRSLVMNLQQDPLAGCLFLQPNSAVRYQPRIGSKLHLMRGEILQSEYNKNRLGS